MAVITMKRFKLMQSIILNILMEFQSIPLDKLSKRYISPTYVKTFSWNYYCSSVHHLGLGEKSFSKHSKMFEKY